MAARRAERTGVLGDTQNRVLGGRVLHQVRRGCEGIPRAQSHNRAASPSSGRVCGVDGLQFLALHHGRDAAHQQEGSLHVDSQKAAELAQVCLCNVEGHLNANLRQN